MGSAIKQEHTFLQDTQGSLMVEGIENWIQNLTVIGSYQFCSDMPAHKKCTPVYMRMKDSKTGAVFEIRRVE